MRARIKRAVIRLYCVGLIPTRLVRVLFSALNLRGE